MPYIYIAKYILIHLELRDIDVGKVYMAVEQQNAEDMENLDPKAVFANERTLLHYAEKGMWLAYLILFIGSHVLTQCSSLF